MKIDGIQLSQGSAISNLVVASGTSFPATPDQGELFYRVDVDTTVRGLYCYMGDNWDRVASTDSSSIQSGNTLPLVGSAGDLFYLNSDDSNEGLYAHNGSIWNPVVGGGGSGSTFNVSGDITGTLDGGVDTLTLATVNSEPQTLTFRKYTVNGKGLVTASTSVVAQNIIDALAYTPVDVAGDDMSGPLTITASSSDPAFRVTQTGSGPALLVEDSTSPDATPFTVLGDGRVIIGDVTSSFAALFQIHSESNANFNQTVYSTTNSAGNGFRRSRGALGVNTIVQNGDILGLVNFQGANGIDYSVGAGIYGTIEGTPTPTSMPTKLQLFTSNDAGIYERFTIGTSGAIAFNTSYGSDGQILTSKGSAAPPEWSSSFAGSAASLTTARNINGVAFDGTADITVPAAAGTLTGTTLASGVTSSSLTSVGELTSLSVGGTVTHNGLIPTAGTNIDQIATFTVSLTLNTTWQDTGIQSTQLETGSYFIQLYANDVSAGGVNSNEYYTGVMSWYAGDPNSSNPQPTDEIVLHRAGGGDEGSVFLRTYRTISADSSDLKLQISSTATSASAANYVFKFRRVI